MTGKRKLSGVWNVNRVLHEYLRFSDDRGNVRVTGHSDDSPHGIEVRRFVAVMKGYGKGESLNLEYCISETCSEEKMNELELLLRKNLDDKYFIAFVNSDILKGIGNRKELLKSLFCYRKSLYKVENLWSGLTECSQAVALAYRLTSNLNKTQIKAVSDVIDRMLVLLMGDDYDKSFSEEELLPFGYPDVTDKELEDMIFDNW